MILGPFLDHKNPTRPTALSFDGPFLSRVILKDIYIYIQYSIFFGCTVADMADSVPFLATGQTLPIQLRVARSHGKVAVNVPFHTQRPLTYGGYSSASMEEAVVAQ